MSENLLDIIKRLDIRQNVTIRIIDEPSGKVVQEHVGHNAATNSLLTGIAHYLMGDGVLNQGGDILTLWVPQYISLGTMGMTSQESETIEVDDVEYIVPAGLGSTPLAPSDASEDEVNLNAELRFSEYINQTPGFGADGYDSNTNNNREWFGLGYPYTLKPDALKQNFYTWDGSATTFTLSEKPLEIISATLYPLGTVDQDLSHTAVQRIVLPSTSYRITTGKKVQFDAYTGETLPAGTRLAVIYTYESSDAVNCELVESKIENNVIVPVSLRSKITYRDMIPEYESAIPSTLDIVFSTYVSTGALKDFRGDRDYVYITEAGLWSKPYYLDGGDNGLLAGYRITPPEILDTEIREEFTGDGVTTTFTLRAIATEIASVNIPGEEVPAYSLNTDTNQIVFATAPSDNSRVIVSYKTADTTDSWKDMTIPDNRKKVQRSILRVGINQVVQVVWKIQLGGLEQLSGLRYLYPSQYQEEVWTIV